MLKAKISQKANSMKNKEGPIQAARRINIKAQFMFRFTVKRLLKNPAKFSERTGPGYLEAVRRPGSSGNAGQLL